MKPEELTRLFTLALAVWREGRGEPPMGKLLIAQTIENRVTDDRWPDDYLSVIVQPWQFSAFNPGDPNATLFPRLGDAVWPDCVAAAGYVINAPAPLTRANHYHTKAVKPAWAVASKVTETAGNHIFYEL